MKYLHTVVSVTIKYFQMSLHYLRSLNWTLSMMTHRPLPFQSQQDHPIDKSCRHGNIFHVSLIYSLTRRRLKKRQDVVILESLGFGSCLSLLGFARLLCHPSLQVDLLSSLLGFCLSRLCLPLLDLFLSFSDRDLRGCSSKCSVDALLRLVQLESIEVGHVGSLLNPKSIQKDINVRYASNERSSMLDQQLNQTWS